LVKTAFLDDELNKKLILTSANSINVARFLPQAFYYFNAYSSLKEQGVLENKELVFSVPSGNLGNITAGLFAREMGLPVVKFIASNNANNVVFEYLETGNYQSRPSVETIANAMDVGAPSNFARILDLYHHSHKTISGIIKGSWYPDEKIREILKEVYTEHNYLCDPHGACGFEALKENLFENQVGVFLETAYPAKFTETVESIIGKGNVPMPEKLAAFMKDEKKSIPLNNEYANFRNYLMYEVFQEMSG
jgi:threonine synthase